MKSLSANFKMIDAIANPPKKEKKLKLKDIFIYKKPRSSKPKTKSKAAKSKIIKARKKY